MRVSLAITLWLVTGALLGIATDSTLDFAVALAGVIAWHIGHEVLG